MSRNELAGLVELLCEECNCLYAVLNPQMDEIEWPVCPSCRSRVREGCEDVITTTKHKED